MTADTPRPTTQAGRISDAMRARMRLHQAWFEAHPNQPMPEGRAQVEGYLAAIEGEARDATGLLAYVKSMALDYPRADGHCPYCSRAMTEADPHGLYCPTTQARAALAATPQEPRWPATAYVPGLDWPTDIGRLIEWFDHLMLAHNCDHQGYEEAMGSRDRLYAALREGAERP